ncbi:MAG: EF-P lysine aminoacylase GenX [Gammaproteobacteria bacterium]|nr:EF-P lysine aminoacylase GenX [Gammaproteobacteria bacterium]NCF83503.1 EF-P lysine aminoacylase GenX [Pseudomonadota bacterium]
MSGGANKHCANDWPPTASLAALRLRARLLAGIREFFAERGVLEVETPAVARAGASDVHIASLATTCGADADHGHFYLQSSPEFAMKRLLAAGSGPIYQVCRAFRDGENGRLHNLEFTLLEWYRPGFDHHDLMGELDALVNQVLGSTAPARRLTYRQSFVEQSGLDPFDASMEVLLERCEACGLKLTGDRSVERDLLLDFLFSHGVQPALGEGLVYVYDYPASQAALARVRAGQPPVAERFELFVNGIEIANGYHELADADEQRKRFAADGRARRALGLEQMPMDERLLAALAHGLPDCAGVAVGLDRLFMIAAGESSIDAVMAFPAARA